MDKEVLNPKTVFSNKTKRAHITISYLCNNFCKFCFQNESDRNINHSYDTIIKKIDSVISDELETLILSGGEPTIHKDILKLIKYCKEKKVKNIQVISNGRMFSNLEFVKKAKNAGLSEVTVSIHGYKKVHDDLVCVKGAYSQAYKAVENLISQNIITSIDYSLFKSNISCLEQFTKEVTQKFGNKIVAINYIGSVRAGRFIENEDELYIHPKEYENKLKSAIDICKKNNVKVWVLNIPLKYLENYESYAQDIEKFDEEARTKYLKFHDRVTPICFNEKSCLTCNLRTICQNLVMIQDKISKKESFDYLVLDEINNYNENTIRNYKEKIDCLVDKLNFNDIYIPVEKIQNNFQFHFIEKIVDENKNNKKIFFIIDLDKTNLDGNYSKYNYKSIFLNEIIDLVISNNSYLKILISNFKLQKTFLNNLLVYFENNSNKYSSKKINLILDFEINNFNIPIIENIFKMVKSIRSFELVNINFKTQFHFINAKKHIKRKYVKNIFSIINENNIVPSKDDFNKFEKKITQQIKLESNEINFLNTPYCFFSNSSNYDEIEIKNINNDYKFLFSSFFYDLENLKKINIVNFVNEIVDYSYNVKIKKCDLCMHNKYCKGINETLLKYHSYLKQN
jgi:MoaA/NifB/PqqE/SkfB family radical SAM enzyme